MYSKYPYTDFHRLNADWLLEKTKECLEAVEGMESDVDGLKIRMTAAEGNITNLQGRMTAAEGDIDTLQQGLGIAEQDVATALDWLNNHEGRIDTLEGDVADLDRNLDHANDAIVTLQGQMDGALDSIDAAEDSIETLSKDVGDLQSTADQLLDAVDTIQGQVNDLTPYVVTFTGNSENNPSTAACDKTYTQISNAVAAGRPLVFRYLSGSSQLPVYCGSWQQRSSSFVADAFICNEPDDIQNSSMLNVFVEITASGVIECVIREL